MLSSTSSRVSSPPVAARPIQSCDHCRGWLAVGIVVVKQPGGQADGGIGDPVEGLRACGHHPGVLDLRVRPGSAARRRVVLSPRDREAAARRPGKPCRRRPGQWLACLCGWPRFPEPACTPIWSTTKRPSRRPRDVSAVAEEPHQLRPGSTHALGTPSSAVRFPRNP